jgi:putative endonuclease
MHWYVYIILCSDNSLYTGITTDVARRFSQHGNGRGAKYFRGRQPEQLVYLESGHTRSAAGRREAAIKRMTRAAKCLLVSGESNEFAVPASIVDQL